MHFLGHCVHVKGPNKVAGDIDDEKLEAVDLPYSSCMDEDRIVSRQQKTGVKG